MVWTKRFIRMWVKCTSKLLLFVLLSGIVDGISPAGFFSELIHRAYAAQVAIDATVSTAQNEHFILGAASVFVSDQVGYKFYVDSGGNCAYSKTTNGGALWGAAISTDAQTDCFSPVVWYDKWTPGDSGQYIHILTADPGNGDLWYNRLDTTNDTLMLGSAPISVVTNTGQGGSLGAGANNGSITKGTNGVLYMSMNDNTDSYVVECSTNCGTESSWTETGINPMDLQPDYSQILPLPDGDLLLINRDISADDIRSKVWDDSAGSWSGAWTTFELNALENATYDPAFNAVVNNITGAILLAYVDNATTGTIGGNNDDIRTWTYSGGVWTAGADVLTNTTYGLIAPAIGVDLNTNNVYVAYLARTTAATATTSRVFYKLSTNGMVSWGVEQGPLDTLGGDDKYGIDINHANYEHLFVSWYGITPDDMFGDTLANLIPATIVSSIGKQKSSVRVGTTNFYTGGSFVVTENIGTRNVTSLTISESGSVHGLNDIDNIKLYYDLDTSAPFNCQSESYNGTELQFGITDTDGFSSANGTSTFTGSVSISTSQSLCVYTILDINKSPAENSTLEIEITNPVTDVVVGGGVNVIPNAPVLIDDQTVLKFERDFKVQRGVGFIPTGSNNLVITAGVDYDTPAASSSAFIRITNTSHTGAGRDSGAGTSNANNTTAYILNPENITNSIEFRRVGTTDNTRISWEIVEYTGASGGENEFIVRSHVPINYVAGSLNATGTAVASVVNDNDVVVFITGQNNNNTGATVYSRGVSTAAWNAPTNQPVFTRGASGDISSVSYAIVEFTGSNWRVQRSEHRYTAVGVTEIENISALNSLSRAFLHTQKRIPASTHANYGHEVWLSGVGQVSFALDASSTLPASHVSVAWVIENTQTTGSPMIVTRSNGTFGTIGTSPQANAVSIGKTLDDLSVASLFVNNRAGTTNNTWPEPILGARLLSTTQYELWRSDIGAPIAYQTEVVEWPTAERKLIQEDFRLYVDNNTLTPIDPWPVGAQNLGENAEMTALDSPTMQGDTVRIRMSLKVSGASVPAGSESFRLEYGKRTTPSCGAISQWLQLGDIGSTTAAWRGINNTPTDGTALSTDPPNGADLLLTQTTVAGSYEEQNNTANNPYTTFPADEIEFDWVVENNLAEDKSSYCFRMVSSSGALLSEYNTYPVIRTVGFEPRITNWRWYDDETNTTPGTPLAAENIAPNNIANQQVIKLRLVLEEVSGANGENTKFALQYSKYADFSRDVTTLTSTTTCTENSIWCYFDGAGIDNGIITTSVISNAGSCVAGLGDGCGTHNEGVSTSTATHDQTAFTNTEYEYTLKQAGARVTAVYYFRLYDMVNDESVSVLGTSTYPSVVTEGAALNLTLTGVNAATTIAGIVTDATTTPTGVTFGSLQFNTDYEAAQQISVTTNATEGYQLLLVADQQLVNSYNDQIPPVTANNTVPLGWGSTCSALASGCFGYHTTDATLFNGSTRFAPTDSYAALEAIPREIMYSSIPTTDTEHVVYKVRVTEAQAAGQYRTDITYIAVPVH